MNEIWILGATGRTGRAVAAKLVTMQMPVVLVGRDETRLRTLAHNIGGAARVLVADSVDAMKAEIARNAPAVVFNTIGPFARTALPIARACLPTTHYVDASNELAATAAILDLNDEAMAAGRTLVSGAGFGVLATESVVLKLCENRPAPQKVRVDAMASLDIEAGTIGAALASTIAEVISFGGRRVRGGRLVRSRSASDAVRLTTPDGEQIGTASGASAELLAAWRASDAEFVVAASSLAPTGIGARVVLPAVSALFRVPGFSGFATGQIARIAMKAQARPRPDSWAHARAQWPNGETREGWLRAGEAMEFTVNVAAQVLSRVAGGEAKPGAFTPGALFGPQLAEDAGGQFLLGNSAYANRVTNQNALDSATFSDQQTPKENTI